MNLSHIRLQYEILNKTLVQLGQENDIPVSMLEDEATKGGWVQWWPESDLVVIVDDNGDDGDEDSEKLQTQTEVFLERSKRRLAVYNVCKEFLLSQKYFELEDRILDAAIDILETMPAMKSDSVQSLGALFKNLMSRSVSNSLINMSFGEDEGGLPTVIVKDLSGTRRRVTS